jgi:hypothetical protein
MLVKINVRAGSLNARHVRAPTLGQFVTNALASDSSSGKLLIGLQADNTQKFSIWQLNKPIVRARDAQPGYLAGAEMAPEKMCASGAGIFS